MAAQVQAKDSGGTTRTIQQVLAKDSGGTVRDIQKIMAKDSGGVVRTVFEAEMIGLDWTTDPLTIYASSSSAAVTVGLLLQSDGTYEEDRDGTITHQDWETKAPSTTGSNYEVKWVLISGLTPTTSPGAQSTWLDSGSNRGFTNTDNVAAAPVKTSVMDITKRKDGDASTEVTRRVTLTADYEDEL